MIPWIIPRNVHSKRELFRDFCSTEVFSSCFLATAPFMHLFSLHTHRQALRTTVNILTVLNAEKVWPKYWSKVNYVTDSSISEWDATSKKRNLSYFLLATSKLLFICKRLVSFCSPFLLFWRVRQYSKWSLLHRFCLWLRNVRKLVSALMEQSRSESLTFLNVSLRNGSVSMYFPLF